MKLSIFSPPAMVDDFGTASLLRQYSDHISRDFDQSITAVNRLLGQHQAGKSQFYNPVTHGLTDVDTPAQISWNGFPRIFGPQHPGQRPNYAGAEPDPANLPVDQGIRHRLQDEYLEWFTHRDGNGRIVRVEFTCEAYDYFMFLASVNKAAVIHLYQTHIDPNVQEADLFTGGKYNPWNDVNIEKGAMHLTHPANALGAEIKLAADATVRRKVGNAEPTNPGDLIRCAEFGDERRNSDPKIGFEVNQLARAGFAITLADPVGLYMTDFDDTGWQFADGTPASGFMKVIRGKAGQAIRAVYELPEALKAAGRTVSDITIGGTPIAFGGQIAEHITMGFEGLACRQGTLSDGFITCGETTDITQVPATAPHSLTSLFHANSPVKLTPKGRRWKS